MKIQRAYQNEQDFSRTIHQIFSAMFADGNDFWSTDIEFEVFEGKTSKISSKINWTEIFDVSGNLLMSFKEKMGQYFNSRFEISASSEFLR